MTDKSYFRLVLAVSVVVFIVVIILGQEILPKPDHIPAFVYRLPALNALINGTCSVLLLISLRYILKGNVTVHKRLNITTFLLSSLFLVSYITYHWLGSHTNYPAESPLRMLYLAILASHIILAALVLPLVLLSFYYGLKMNVRVHKRLVRWTFPIWLYVTVTGVVVYLMISPYYKF